MVLGLTPLHDGCLVQQEVGQETLIQFFFQLGHRSTPSDQPFVFFKVLEPGHAVFTDQDDNLGRELHSDLPGPYTQ